MFKNLYLFYLLLGCFLLSPCNDRIFASQAFFTDSAIELTYDSQATSKWIQEGLFDPALQLDGNSVSKEITYILYARPNGELGNQLRRFWKAVKDKNLANPAVFDYPPHVTLTGFFPIDNPDDSLEEQKLIDSLQAAIESVDITPINIAGKSIKTSNSLDYISIKNSVGLRNVTKDFLEGAGIDPSYFRPKPKSTIGYHISLREKPDEKISQKKLKQLTSKIRKLEKDNIDLSTPNLQEDTSWRLYIYKKTGKKLEIIYQQSIIIQ
jgi:hypothetical protein